jgi:predicted RNA binding protein YcfA (HicA-like mRNA interferase family)
MARREKLYNDIMSRSSNNIAFRKIETFLDHWGFTLKNQNGSHRIYEHSLHHDIYLNIQEKNGEVKGYQLKQIREAIIKIEDIEKVGN